MSCNLRSAWFRGAVVAASSVVLAGCQSAQSAQVEDSDRTWSSSVFGGGSVSEEAGSGPLLALDASHPAYSRNDHRMGRAEPGGPVSREWTWHRIDDVQRSSHGRPHDTLTVRRRTIRGQPGQ